VPIPRLLLTALVYSAVLRQLLLLSCRTLLIATLHGPHGKHSLYCWRSQFTVPLPSNRYPIIVCSFVAGMCLPTPCLAMGIHVTIFFL
jgi:hypothetical protein